MSSGWALIPVDSSLDLLRRPRLCIRDILLGRASSPAVIDKQGESGCGALGRETPRQQDLEPSRAGRVMNDPG